jgi:hypothetical protein
MNFIQETFYYFIICILLIIVAYIFQEIYRLYSSFKN